MDREIKFRAWNKTMGIMVDLQKLTPLATEIDGLFIPKSDDIIPLQYTGLKDCKRNEIYEGDIVKYNHSYPSFSTDLKYTAIVKYELNEFHSRFIFKPVRCDDFVHDMLFSNCEIIGNIFENPELLLEVKDADKDLD
jgi:uncharacterized phage protein (TIGR01671 family)